MAKQSYAIIGLGRFGTSIASKLFEAEQEVLGIDINEDRLLHYKEEIPFIVVGTTGRFHLDENSASNVSLF